MRNLSHAASQDVPLPALHSHSLDYLLTLPSSTALGVVLPGGRQGPTSARAATTGPPEQHSQGPPSIAPAAPTPFLEAPCSSFPCEH